MRKAEIAAPTGRCCISGAECPPGTSPSCPAGKASGAFNAPQAPAAPEQPASGGSSKGPIILAAALAAAGLVAAGVAAWIFFG